ncbi:MAG: hypothetical protein GY719_39375 [bacterium]|nr:hypothetical protein [bacterium]
MSSKRKMGLVIGTCLLLAVVAALVAPLGALQTEVIAAKCPQRACPYGWQPVLINCHAEVCFVENDDQYCIVCIPDTN